MPETFTDLKAEWQTEYESIQRAAKALNVGIKNDFFGPADKAARAQRIAERLGSLAIRIGHLNPSVSRKLGRYAIEAQALAHKYEDEAR